MWTCKMRYVVSVLGIKNHNGGVYIRDVESELILN